MESTIGDGSKIGTFPATGEPCRSEFSPERRRLEITTPEFVSRQRFELFWLLRYPANNEKQYQLQRLPSRIPLYRGHAANKLNSETDKSATDTRPIARDSKVVLPPRRWKALIWPCKIDTASGGGVHALRRKRCSSQFGSDQIAGILFSAINFGEAGRSGADISLWRTNRHEQDRLLADRTVSPGLCGIVRCSAC